MENSPVITVPGIGAITVGIDFFEAKSGGNGLFQSGKNGVRHILRPADNKTDFIVYDNYTLAFIHSQLGYPAIYPVHPVQIKTPVEAILMDLDGTSVHSEEFWIWIIQQTIASLLGNPRFELEDADLPFVSGHSVSEHLQYCLDKYCPEKTVEAARVFYFEHTHREMAAIVAGTGRKNAFVPVLGLREFLSKLKERGIKIGLVTSGLYEKAWPEILSAFQTLGMGDPAEFYDAIITAGYPIRPGAAGTLGELSPKPHPWLYAETARVGLGIDFSRRQHVVGMEDSGAGVVSIRLAGFAAIGMTGGNIEQSGTQSLLSAFCDNFSEAAEFILD